MTDEPGEKGLDAAFIRGVVELIRLQNEGLSRTKERFGDLPQGVTLEGMNRDIYYLRRDLDAMQKREGTRFRFSVQSALTLAAIVIALLAMILRH